LPESESASEAALASMRAEMTQASRGLASCRSALDFALSEPRELAIVGPDALPTLCLARSTYRPATNGAATAYLCRHFACERPVMTVDDLAALL